MISLLVTIALSLSLGIGSAGVKPQTPANSFKTAVLPFNTKGLPVTIKEANAENSLDVSYLTCLISNSSQDEVTALHLQVFIVDSENHLKEVRDGLSVETLSPGKTRLDTVEIKSAIGLEGKSFVAVTKVVSRSGIWQVDQVILEKAIKAKLALEPDVELSAGFEPNVAVTKDDRSEIFKLVLEDILRDESKAARLKDRSTVILLSEGLDINLPPLGGSSLTIMNLDEIKKIANVRGRVVYLIYQPFVVEGSRVLARIGLRDRVSQLPNVPHVPLKYTFVFTCIKKDGRWTIEESTGYAQS
jgi:hypothetical protein